jgi:hypothetical protein
MYSLLLRFAGTARDRFSHVGQFNDCGLRTLGHRHFCRRQVKDRQVRSDDPAGGAKSFYSNEFDAMLMGTPPRKRT